jgi:Tfp pilus assembly PilM family ATPase
MAITKRLGLYWGDTGIDLVEIGHEGPKLTSKVSFADLENNPVIGVKALTEDLRLLDLLQKSIRNSAFSTVDTYLSLPSKDIIIRWFVIPWMKPSEIEGVVSFESRKYLPFPLEDLVYTYYPSPFNKGGVRQIGVIFVCIRKSNLDKYVNVLLQAGLNVVCSEPASMSLIRALVLKKVMEVDRVTAVLNVHQDYGEILIASQGFVKFTRDFKIHAPTQQQTVDGQDVAKARFFNEVKIALEFFSRQHVDEEVQKIIVLSSGLYKDLWSGLGEELSLPVMTCDVLSILGNAESAEIGYMNAYGAALSGTVPVVVDFNLSEGQGQAAKAGKAKREGKPTQKIAYLALSTVLSLSLLTGTFLWTGKMLDRTIARKQVVVAKLGTFADMDLADITNKSEIIQTKFTAIRSLRFKGNTTPFVISLVKLLPPGVWLQNVSVEFEDVPEKQLKMSTRAAGLDPSGAPRKPKAEYYTLKTRSRLVILGYCYLENANEEFNAVNQYLTKLKSSEEIAARFQEISLQSVKSEEMEDHQVVSFMIKCE